MSAPMGNKSVYRIVYLVYERIFVQIKREPVTVGSINLDTRFLDNIFFYIEELKKS